MFQYTLKRETEKIADLFIQIESLEDLDRTIDRLFETLQKTGDERLLEDLCPYFGVVWPSARALAEQLVAQGGPSRATGHAPVRGAGLTGKRVLEIGCGLALPSLVAAKLGARVTATDFHPEVPFFLERNLKLNGISDFEYLALNWREQRLPSESYDWIIGSDILYESYQPPHVARVIAEYLAPTGHAIIADPGRPYLQAFEDEMKRAGFSSRLIPKGNIFVLEFTRI